MPTAIKPIAHEERLSLVDHLDELRTRLIICIVAFVVAFAFCIWQDDALLEILNKPIQQTTSSSGTKNSGGRLEQQARFQVTLRTALIREQQAINQIARSVPGLTPVARVALLRAIKAQGQAIAQLPKETPKRQPVTLGVGEPFTTTLTVSAWFALIFSLPIILFQFYAFILPAFTPNERKVALPLLLMIPFLFITGVVFGYFVVVPPAVRFLQSFNDQSFDILVQAKDYYRFVLLALLGMGILFQIPVGILAATRMGIVTPRQLRKNRRYAVLIIAVVAMLLPGTDPVTMLIAMLPLIILFEGSIILASALDRRRPTAGDQDGADVLDGTAEHVVDESAEPTAVAVAGPGAEPHPTEPHPTEPDQHD